MASKKFITDLRFRDEIEKATVFAIAGILKNWEAKISITDPSIPPGQLDQMDRELAAVLLLALMQVFRSEATALAGQLGLSTSNIEAESAEWARTKTAEVVKEFRKETLARLQKAKLKQDLDNAAALALILSTQRAITLGSTYVTQAASAGEIRQRQRVSQELPQVEIQPDGTLKPVEKPFLRAIWNVRKDDRVCPKCSPLDGKDEDVWGPIYPDGPGTVHPRCRCFLTYKA